MITLNDNIYIYRISKKQSQSQIWDWLFYAKIHQKFTHSSPSTSHPQLHNPNNYIPSQAHQS